MLNPNPETVTAYPKSTNMTQKCCLLERKELKTLL